MVGSRHRGSTLDHVRRTHGYLAHPCPSHTQPEGGPCGVIASMNAFVLRELLFPSSGGSGGTPGGAGRRRGREWENPPAATQRTALLKVMTRYGLYDLREVVRARDAVLVLVPEGSKP